MRTKCTFLLLTLLLCSGIFYSNAQCDENAVCGDCGTYTYPDDFPGDNNANEDIDQGANGKTDAPLDTVEWQNGNLNGQNSHFIEGHSVPYRAIFTDVPTCTPIRLTLNFDVLESGHFALDYLTSYQQLEPHNAPFGHDEEIVAPLRGLDLTGCTFDPDAPTTASLPEPCAGDATTDAILTSSFADLEADHGDQVMSAWGAQICDMWYGLEDGTETCPDLSGSCINGDNQTVTQYLTIEFMATNDLVVFAWGGHISKYQDYGYCDDGVTSAASSGLSGSPYHMRLDGWTLNNIGNMDRSLKIDAVFAQPECAIYGDSAQCQDSILTFSTNPLSPESDAGYTYQWEIINNNSNATIVGASNEREVDVNVGDENSSFEIQVTIDGDVFTTSSTCSRIIDVHPSLECTASNDGPLTCDKTEVTLEGSLVGARIANLVYDNSMSSDVDLDNNSPDYSYTAFTLRSDFTSLEEDYQRIDVEEESVTNSARTRLYYSWTGPDGFTSDQQSPKVSEAGTYELIISDSATGCQSICETTVEIDTLKPECSIDDHGILTCTTTSITLDGTSSTAGATYEWNTGATTATIDVTEPGTYTVTMTAPNGCTSECSTEVEEDTEKPECSIDDYGVLTCTTTSITLDGTSSTAGATYEWNTGATTATIDVTEPGTYTVTVTAPNGCTSECSTEVEEDTEKPECSIDDHGVLTCTTTSITLDGTSSTAGATYEWNTGATTATIDVTEPGTYTVTVTAPNGCTSECSAEVEEDTEKPECSIDDHGVLTCTTTSITLDGTSSTAGATYEWNTGATTATIDVTEPGYLYSYCDCTKWLYK